MILLLWNEYRKTGTQELSLCLKAFAVLGISGVLALILYWIFSIYWYDTVFQFGILLYIAFLFWGCSVRWQMTRSSGWNRPFTKKECLWKTV